MPNYKQHLHVCYINEITALKSCVKECLSIIMSRALQSSYTAILAVLRVL